MIPLRDDVPARLAPIVTVSLIVACSAVFLWQLSLGQRGSQVIAYSLGLVPATLFGHESLPPQYYLVPPAATVLTSMFLHGGWLHLIGNMLYLWIFGNNVEDAMGHARFIVFYVVCGIIAAMAQAVPNPDSVVPMIGASGAISGVLGAYLLLYPRAHVLVLIPLGFYAPLVRLPAMLVLGLWFLMQLVSQAFAESEGGGVAFGAHIGGFVAGIALIAVFKRRNVRLFAR